MSDKVKGGLFVGALMLLFIGKVAQGFRDSEDNRPPLPPITLSCGTCHGTGQADCPHCNNGTVTNAFGPNYSCGVCGGDGKLWCSACVGRGRK